MVLVHGAWSGAWAWDRWHDALAAAGHDLHVPDLPGHGDDVAALTNGLRLDDYVDAVVALVEGLDAPPVLVGHSMGGAVVQRLLTREPDLALAGVALLATVPDIGVLTTVGRVARMAPGPFLKANATLDLHAIFRDVGITRRLLFSRDAPGQDVVEGHAALQGESYRAFLDMVALPALVDPRPLDVPAMVLAGADDALFSVAEQRRTAEAWDADLVVVERLAHYVQLEPNGGAARDELLAFLDRVHAAA